MADRFEPGEVAIYHRPGNSKHGMECTIIRFANVSRRSTNIDTGEKINIGPHYVVSFGFSVPPFEDKWSALPEWLRKKRPPASGRDIDQTVSWDAFHKATGWRPASVPNSVLS